MCSADSWASCCVACWMRATRSASVMMATSWRSTKPAFSGIESSGGPCEVGSKQGRKQEVSGLLIFRGAKEAQEHTSNTHISSNARCVRGADRGRRVAVWRRRGLVGVAVGRRRGRRHARTVVKVVLAIGLLTVLLTSHLLRCFLCTFETSCCVVFRNLFFRTGHASG